MDRLLLPALGAGFISCLALAPAGAQASGGHASMDHGAHMQAGNAAGGETGQAAFAAIADVVRQLKADPSTDWTTVNIDALRQHLVDMNEVVLNAEVAPQQVPGGVALTITGSGRTLAAIRAMLTNHGAELAALPAYAARTEALPNGVRLTVTARDPSDTRTVAMIRGLGFAGLLTEGAHHAVHHLDIARGGHSHRH